MLDGETTYPSYTNKKLSLEFDDRNSKLDQFFVYQYHRINMIKLLIIHLFIKRKSIQNTIWIFIKATTSVFLTRICELPC